MSNKVTVSHTAQGHTAQVPSSIHPSSHQSLKASDLGAGFCRIWKDWLTQLRCSPELQLWQTSDAWGNTWWHIHHSVTGNTVTRESEAEILAWIDQHSSNE